VAQSIGSAAGSRSDGTYDTVTDGRVRVLLLTLTALLPQQPAAVTGVIHGRVAIPQPPPPLAARPNVADLGAAPARDLPDRRRSVVYLEVAPQPAFDEREERVVMDQRHERFVPHVLAITAGTTVDFLNSDSTYHNVFSLSRARTFDLGRYPTGRSRAVRFDRPGIVRVFCDIHSHMSAFILVFSHRYFAMTDDEGRYRLPDVPPGSYTVTVWNEALPAVSRQVTVGAGGGDVRVDFTLERR
jgi:plastocyanin